MPKRKSILAVLVLIAAFAVIGFADPRGRLTQLLMDRETDSPYHNPPLGMLATATRGS